MKQTTPTYTQGTNKAGRRIRSPPLARRRPPPISISRRRRGTARARTLAANSRARRDLMSDFNLVGSSDSSGDKDSVSSNKGQ